MGNNCSGYTKKSNKEKAIKIIEHKSLQNVNNTTEINQKTNELLVGDHKTKNSVEELYELIQQANDNSEYYKSKLISLSNDVDILKNEILKQNRIIATLQSNVMIHTDQTTIKSIQKVIHTGVKCDICGAYPIQGYRYKCSICSNWDCCSKCESKHDHPLIQFKNHSANSTTTKNISDDNKHTTECVCICGTKMKYIQSNVAYKNGNSIVCDGCRVSVSGAIRVYHCPNETNTSHRGGYDLCVSCSNKRMLNSKKSTAINTKINVDLINEHKKNSNNIIGCTGNDITQCASYHRLLTTMSKYDTE
eukprot:84650_1